MGGRESETEVYNLSYVLRVLTKERWTSFYLFISFVPLLDLSLNLAVEMGLFPF